jgi:transcription initiation factor IIE alpha subunit
VAKIIGVRFGYTPDDLLFSSASSNAKVLYSALTRYCNAEDRAWPTEQTLTNRLGWSESTVRRAIAELLRLGWLSKRQSRVNHGGTWAHNVYTLNTKPTLQRKKLRRHRRSNLTAGAD